MKYRHCPMVLLLLSLHDASFTSASPESVLLYPGQSDFYRYLLIINGLRCLVPRTSGSYKTIPSQSPDQRDNTFNGHAHSGLRPGGYPSRLSGDR